MNIQDVFNIMDRFEGSCMNEMELELDGAKIVFRKGAAGNMTNMPAVNTVMSQVSSEPVAAQSSVNSSKSQSVEQKEENNAPVDGVEIKAKVAGTFYRAKSPDSEPYIQPGQKIKEGDVIGMIEAMKMMNEITSTVSGEVVSIVANNEDIVGYDDVLVIVKPE